MASNFYVAVVEDDSCAVVGCLRMSGAIESAVLPAFVSFEGNSYYYWCSVL